MKFFLEALSQSRSLDAVCSGQEITIRPDLLVGHDGTWQKVQQTWAKDNYALEERMKLLLTIDHAFPAPTVEDRKRHKEMATICAEGKCSLFQNGEGVLHQVLAEEYDLKPGMIIVGADGHVATAGAFGAIAFSVSGESLAEILVSGEYTMTVPEIVTLYLDGQTDHPTMARDIALHILGKYKQEITNKAVLLKGSFIKNASVAVRMTLCNLLPEGGAVTAVLPLQTSEDEGSILHINVAEIGRMAAIPPGPTHVVPLKALVGTKIDTAIVGGCSSGRMEDMRICADVLNGRRIHPGVTFIVTPASAKVANEMDQERITKILRNSGAVIMPPGCGPCPGRHFGVLDSDDVAITTTIRNTPGRIGDKEARVYLASPYSVAMAAIAGEIQ